MDFKCDYCGRGHDEESSNHDCNHSLCFTYNNHVDGCPKCEAEKRVVANAEREERARREAEEARINAVTECCICMDTIQITNRAVTGCGHVFCLGCLLQYLKTKNDCPMCRRTAGPPPRILSLEEVMNNDVLYERLISRVLRVTPRPPASVSLTRRCGVCRQPGHNQRTCRVAQANAQVHG